MIKKITGYTIVRYLVGGGSSAVVNLSIFYILNSLLKIHYITASIFSFIVAFFVSWMFHKFWTFRDHSTENMHIQGFYYLLSSLFGLCLNTAILYSAVNFLSLIPFWGQVVAGGLTASCTFFISKNLIFNKKEEVKKYE